MFHHIFIYYCFMFRKINVPIIPFHPSLCSFSLSHLIKVPIKIGRIYGVLIMTFCLLIISSCSSGKIVLFSLNFWGVRGWRKKLGKIFWICKTENITKYNFFRNQKWYIFWTQTANSIDWFSIFTWGRLELYYFWEGTLSVILLCEWTKLSKK